MDDLPTGPVTFLFTDIEGSTRLVAALGDGYLALHDLHQRLIRAAAAEHHGREVSTEGDSFFFVFRDPADAVAATTAAQQALAAAAWPVNTEVRVRMGVHTGHGVRGGDNYIGLDVNRAARIAASGHGGQILLSDATRLSVQDALPAGVGLQDLGRHRLRDVGVEHLWQVDVPGLSHRFGALRTLEAHPSNLPAELTPIIDREAERTRLTEMILGSPIVTVTGPGGIGKSRLAIRCAMDLVERMPDGAFYLDAAAFDSADLLVDELVRMFGARTAGEDAASALFEHLRDRALLLLIDTADRVRGIGPLVGQIGAGCPNVRILVTSRAPLRVAGERESPLGPLPIVTSGSPEAVAASPGVRLFVERARAVRPDFDPSGPTIGAIARICARLDGLPLAIELAAARIRVLTPDAMEARLGRRLSLLTGGAVNVPDRQRTLRATIDWSYELLAPAEQAMLARLAIFPGAFDLDDVEGIWPDPADGEALDLVGALVDHSLVVASAVDGETRFRLLATIREFAQEMLDAGGDRPAAEAAHAAYFLRLAERWGPEVEGERDLAAISRLERAQEDLRGALAWLLAPEQDATLALQMTAALGRFWYLRGQVREGRDWLERALAGAPSAPDELRARALFWAGVLAEEAREPSGAAQRLEECLRLQRELGDERGVARTLNSLGVVARSMGDLDRAEALLLDSLARKRALGDVHGVAGSLSNLGLLAADRGRLEEARDRFTEALALDRAAGERGAEAYSLNNLGASLIWLGNVTEGAAAVRQALRVLSDLDDADGIAEGIEHLAEAAAGVGDYPTAARLVLTAQVLRERSGAPLRDVDAVRVRAVLRDSAANVPPDDLADMRAAAATLDARSAAQLALATAIGDGPIVR